MCDSYMQLSYMYRANSNTDVPTWRLIISSIHSIHVRTTQGSRFGMRPKLRMRLCMLLGIRQYRYIAT
jgi:hypothetical protein